MRADNTRHLVAATQRRAEQTRQKAVAALRRMAATGKPINIDALAREARVSRSWIYAQHDLRAEIERIRERQPHPTTATVPDRQRASDTSLLRRLEAANDRIRRLEEDNRQLRAALAQALGQRRTDDILGPTTRCDTPKKKSSKLIDPG